MFALNYPDYCYQFAPTHLPLLLVHPRVRSLVLVDQIPAGLPATQYYKKMLIARLYIPFLRSF